MSVIDVQPLAFFIFAFTFVVVLFIVLKSKFPTIFQPRTFLVPKPELVNPLPSGAFRWIHTIIDTPERTIIEKCGYDAYFFLRFLQMIFFRVFFYPLTIILPVYAAGGLPTADDPFVKVTNTKQHWGLLTVAIFYIAYLCWVFNSESKLHSEDREQYLRTCQAGDQPTVLVTGISRWLNHKDLLEVRFNDAVKDVGGKVLNVSLNRNLSLLNGLAKRRLDISRRLEERITTMIRVNTLLSPDPEYRPMHRRWIFWGRPVDTIFWYWIQLNSTKKDLQYGQTHSEEFEPIDSAFVTFNTQIAAQVASSCKIDFRDRSWPDRLRLNVTMRRRVVAPHFMLWDNLPIGLGTRYFRTFVLAIAFILALVLSASPIEYLGVVLLGESSGVTSGSGVEGSPAGSNTSQPGNYLDALGLGRQSAFSTSLLLSILIALVRSFVIRRGVYITWEMETEAHWCNFISLFLKILVFPFTGDPLRPVNVEVRLQLRQLFLGFFYIDFMLLQIWLICTAILLQLQALLPMILFPFTTETPRNCWARWSSMRELAWGTVLPGYTILACIGLLCSVTRPLIALLTMIGFFLFWVVNRYAVLYCIKFRCDTGGIHYLTAINHLFLGVYAMEIGLAGLFLLVQDESGTAVCKIQAFIMVASLVGTIGWQIWVNKGRPSDCEIIRKAHVIHHEFEERAFDHPAVKARTPAVWIPKDAKGLSDAEVWRTWRDRRHYPTENESGREHLGGARITNVGAYMRPGGGIILNGDPPGNAVDD